MTIAEQAEHWAPPLWATPSVPNGGRSTSDSNYKAGKKRQIDIGAQASKWATPRAEDSECCGNHPNANDSQTRLWQTPQTDSFRSRSGERKEEQGLDQQARAMWPTPTAEPYGSSQNSINGLGGEHEARARTRRVSIGSRG